MLKKPIQIPFFFFFFLFSSSSSLSGVISEYVNPYIPTQTLKED